MFENLGKGFANHHCEIVKRMKAVNPALSLLPVELLKRSGKAWGEQVVNEGTETVSTCNDCACSFVEVISTNTKSARSTWARYQLCEHRVHLTTYKHLMLFRTCEVVFAWSYPTRNVGQGWTLLKAIVVIACVRAYVRVQGWHVRQARRQCLRERYFGLGLRHGAKV